MLKDSGGALRDFDRAVKISPHSAHIYFNRANLYASTGAHEKAERDYTKSQCSLSSCVYVCRVTVSTCRHSSGVVRGLLECPF